MTGISFLRPGRPEDIVAARGSELITRAQFQRDVAALAACLPAQPYVLNHCEDRYRFFVGLAATLGRDQVSLFPSNRAPEVLADLRREYPGVYCLSDQENPEENSVMNVCRFDTSAPVDSAAELRIPADRLVAIAFTSGSTGKPKHYHKFWGGLVDESRVAGDSLGLLEDRRTHLLATVPAQHMYGFVYSVIMPARWGLIVGAERPFYPEDIRKTLASRQEPAILVTTPVHIRACVLDEIKLPEIDFILSSTAPLDAELAANAENRFGCVVQEFYGSTETGAIARRRQADGADWHTFSGIRVALVESGFQVSADYLPEPQILGDRVEVRDESTFVLHGRNSELIKIAGKRVALGDLNRQLLAIEGVTDGTFFLPDADNGREPRLTAFVVAPSLSREQVLEQLRSRIDPVFLPRPLRIVSELPRNSTGKLPRGNLAGLHRELEAREPAP